MGVSSYTHISKGEAVNNDLVQELYVLYAKKLLSYTLRNFGISEDDATSLVYKTVYRVSEVYDRYSFANEKARAAFVFKTHINFLRNYYRDNKSFERMNAEVKIQEFADKTEESSPESAQLKALQEILFPAHWDPKLRIPRGQVVAAASIVSPKY